MSWRKSSKCSTGECVEVSCPHWHKASRSDVQNCVEVCDHHGVYVRDSKDREGPVLEFEPEDWQRFVNWLR